MLAAYASNPDNTRGRFYQDSGNLSIISPFENDRVRIIESTAFRRLEHKTQVFVSHEGDHYRNRLTHSLEAAQISRTISKALNISADLAESITLAHDLGHAPFGHAGEDALNEVMSEFNGVFDHNDHTIKLLTNLEQKFAQFDGLNLTWECLEGVAKHNRPLLPKGFIAIYNNMHNLELDKFPSLEAQISSFSDDIAYNNHDIDDGFRAGFISIDDLYNVPIFGEVIAKTSLEYPGIEQHKLVHESVQRMKNIMILDLIKTTQANIKKYAIENCDDIRNANVPIAAFSNEIELYNRQIKTFLAKKVYKHYIVSRMGNKAKRVIKELFHIYMNDVGCLPENWQKNIALLNQQEKAVVICDFIACMTDRFAISEYRSFFDLSITLY